MKTELNQTTSLDHLQSLAIDELTGFFEDKKGEEEVKRERARMAMGTLSAVSRLRGTERVKDATQFAIIRTITNDPKIRMEYIKATLPQYCPKNLPQL